MENNANFSSFDPSESESEFSNSEQEKNQELVASDMRNSKSVKEEFAEHQQIQRFEGEAKKSRKVSDGDDNKSKTIVVSMNSQAAEKQFINTNPMKV